MTYVVGEVVLICRKAAILSKKTKTPATKTAARYFCSKVSKILIDIIWANSPFTTAMIQNIGAMATELAYTKSITPKFSPDTNFFMTIVSTAVVSDDHTPHTMPAVGVCPNFSPDTPNKNPHIVIAHATRARVLGFEFGRNIADRAMVKGNNKPRAIW